MAWKKTKSLLTKFSADTKIGNMVNNEEDKSLIQSDLDHVESWAQANNMHCHTAKGKCVHLGTKTVGHIYRIGDCILGSRDPEKDLGSMVDNQQNMSAPCDAVAKRANTILGCINRNLGLEQSSYFNSVFGTGATTAGIRCPVLVPTTQKRG